MADKRTLKQRVHDSEVKWDCYMRSYAWSEAVDKDSILWFLQEKAAGHEALLERYRSQWRWWHWLMGVKKPNVIRVFRDKREARVMKRTEEDSNVSKG